MPNSAIAQNKDFRKDDAGHAAVLEIDLDTTSSFAHGLIRMRLERAGLGIAAVDTLASNGEPFDDITLGVAAGNVFYFNAAGQWSLFGDDGKMPDAAKLKPATVLHLKFEE